MKCEICTNTETTFLILRTSWIIVVLEAFFELMRSLVWLNLCSAPDRFRMLPITSKKPCSLSASDSKTTNSDQHRKFYWWGCLLVVLVFWPVFFSCWWVVGVFFTVGGGWGCVGRGGVWWGSMGQLITVRNLQLEKLSSWLACEHNIRDRLVEVPKATDW